MGRRRVWAVVGVVLIWASAAAGQATTNWADALFSEHGVDFGAVPRGAKVRHAFRLTNRLGEAVTVLDVRASCGCTSGRTDSTTIPPGGQAVVEAEMDTRNFVGLKATTLTVALATASGRQGEARFAVQANILPDIVLNPGSVEFGVVSQGQTPQQVVAIERLGQPNWRFTKVIASEAFCKIVEATLVESYREGSGVGYELTIRLKPDAPVGVIRDEIQLLSNDPHSPSVPVLVTGQVQGSLTVTPALLVLGRAPASGQAQARILVRGGQPFQITRIEGHGDGFTLSSPEPTPRTLHVLTLTYRADQGTTRGDLKRSFRITTDLPGEPPLTMTATIHVDP